MFNNFIEEAATGTGNTITLLGATDKKIVVIKAYPTGGLINYVIEDGDGIKKVTGVGMYDHITNTLTRADNWNYNGTIIDNNPSSNIALSGGVHTLRISITANNAKDWGGSKFARIGGLHTVRADDFWISYIWGEGNASHLISQVISNGVNPAPNYKTHGQIVRKNTLLKSVFGFMQPTTTDLTTIAVRIYLTHAIDQATLDSGDWNSVATTANTMLYSNDNLFLSNTAGWASVNFDLGNHIATIDSSLVIATRTVSVLSANRKIVSNIALEYV